jgi:hypothetical protein
MTFVTRDWKHKMHVQLTISLKKSSKRGWIVSCSFFPSKELRIQRCTDECNKSAALKESYNELSKQYKAIEEVRLDFFTFQQQNEY